MRGHNVNFKLLNVMTVKEVIENKWLENLFRMERRCRHQDWRNNNAK